MYKGVKPLGYYRKPLDRRRVAIRKKDINAILRFIRLINESKKKD